MPRASGRSPVPFAAVGALAGVATVKAVLGRSWSPALVAAAGFAAAGLVWTAVEHACREASRGPHDPTALDERALDRFARSERSDHRGDAAVGPAPDLAPPLHPPRQEPP